MRGVGLAPGVKMTWPHAYAALKLGVDPVLPDGERAVGSFTWRCEAGRFWCDAYVFVTAVLGERNDQFGEVATFWR